MKSRFPVFFRVFTLLLILSVAIIWINREGLAQSLEPLEDNNLKVETQAGQGMQPANLADDNHFGTKSAAEQPDLVIEDPQADIAQLIEEYTGVAATGSLVIPAADFSVDGNTRSWFFGFNTAHIFPNGGSYCGIAPVYLPHGAVVTSILSSVYDNDATHDIFFLLYAKPLGSMVGATIMASSVTSAASTNLRLLIDATIDQATINNNLYTYYIGVCLWGTDDNQRFYASALYYTQ